MKTEQQIKDCQITWGENEDGDGCLYVDFGDEIKVVLWDRGWIHAGSNSLDLVEQVADELNLKTVYCDHDCEYIHAGFVEWKS